MAGEQDVVQLPFKVTEINEDMLVALHRNFKEIERHLSFLQMQVKFATGGGVANLKDSAKVWDRAENITEDGTILTEKLEGLIEELQIADGAVSELKLKDLAVNSAKLAENAVIMEKIADGAVDTDKLAANAVVAEKINANAVTSEKIYAGAVTADKIGAAAITADKIAAGAITAEKVSVDKLSAITSDIGTINAGTINGLKITGGNIYGAVIQSGEEGATSYIRLGSIWEPLSVVQDGKIALNIWAGFGGGMMQFYDAAGNMRGQIVPMNDAMGQGLRITARSGSGADDKTLGLQGLNLQAWFDQQIALRTGNNGWISIDSGSGGIVYITGSTTVNGNLSCTGQKPAIQVTENYGLRYMCATEAPELVYYDRGVVNLIDGEATVCLDPIYLECIEPDSEKTPWQIWVQCYGENDVYVSEVGKNYFRVKERNGGTSSNRVIWKHEAIRNGYAGIRLMEAIDL